MHALRFPTFLLFGLIALHASASGMDFKIRPDREDGLYAPGEEVTWTIETVELGEGESAPDTVSYVLQSNGLLGVGTGTLDMTDGRATFTATRNDPGALLFTVMKGDVQNQSGAAFAPEALQPTLPRPQDFDEFWAAKLKEADAVALNPQLTPEESSQAGTELWQITFDNIRGTKVHGQLARPKDAEGKLPAMLIVQWAGVYPLQKDWACQPASEGWLVLNILAHDLPIYEPQSFYDELKEGALKDYPKIGNDDRETSYFLRMYLSCYQAVRYLKDRPDWDGKTLVVRGTSQGGMQTLVTAALCNDFVTAACAKVPAGCDLNGPVNRNAPGWPRSYYATGGKDPEKVRQTAQYFDVVNFAPDIRCPTLIGMGLADVTCPPAGIFIAANQIEGPVEIVTMPSSGHQATDLDPHSAFTEQESLWLKEIKAGEIPLTVGQ